MAKGAKRKSSFFGQLVANFSAGDDRVPKITGLLLLLVSLYLFIAFSSYLFTWEEDFSQVDRFSWSILFETELEVSNWLGRLGAIVSHQFFCWWFGLPSYILVFLTFLTGVSLVVSQPLSTLRPVYMYSVLGMLWLSVVLRFVLFNSSFPVGGAFGDAVNIWLKAFLGTVGMAFFIVFTIIAFLFWTVNPNVQELTFRGFLSQLGDKLGGLNPISWFVPTAAPQTTTSQAAAKTGTSKTTQLDDTDEWDDHTTTNDTNAKALAAQERRRKIEEQAKQTANDDDLATELLINRQLQLNLENEKNKKQAASLSSSDLEIEEPILETYSDNEYTDTDQIQERAFMDKTAVDTPNPLHQNLEPYDPTLELSTFENPVLPLLEEYADQKITIDRTELEQNKDQIIATLLNYKIEITKIKATIGPTVTLYEIVPAPGVRISKIKSLEDDIALSLAALGIRIIAPIPGKGTIGIEVPNKNKQVVSLKEVLSSDKFRRAQMDLPIALGKTISNEVFVADLAKMPHLLIAGATGQGKSVGINTILMSLLYKKHPSQLKLILVDPKKVELSLYNEIDRHFLGQLPGEPEAIITDTAKVVNTLNSLCIEMDQRYELLKMASVRHVTEYNQKFVNRRLNPEKGHRYLPFIVLVIDEFADMIMTAGKEVELPIGRLAQLARAVGIHLIIATQRPSVNIITGVIKANFPARIAFKVASKIDSRTILDGGGAEQLIGRGDMLLSVDGKVIRVQCAFVDTPEVERVIDFIAKQPGYPEPYLLPEFNPNNPDTENPQANFNIEDLDEFFEDAARVIVQNQIGSTSMIQRRLKLGYNRAGRIMDQLEVLGIVGPNEGSKSREVLIYDEQELERYLEQVRKMKKRK
jgi:S-DNA-T family DNA segregation ATPase FtsK/SpoIIIE